MERLSIPPEFSSYSEEKGIFTLYEGMLQVLLTVRPDCPLQFLSQYLSVDRSKIPNVVVYGPPCSGQNSVSKLIARKLRAVHVVAERVLREDQSPAGTEARTLAKEGKEVTPSLWATVLHSRTQQSDCQEKGWVLEGYPRSREQALALQSKGVIATHFVHLTCPDAVLIERYGGKRIDPLTGDVYHLVFSPPTSETVASRLVEEEGGASVNLHTPLTLYHRHTQSLLSAFPTISKTFDADQPIGDLVTQVHNFLCTHKRSLAPHTPRVVLLGPCGSGKSVQAAKLAHKYDIIDVDCGELVRQEMVSGSSLADKMRPFIDSNMMVPDDMLLSVVARRLSCLDCTSRGWVLHGFPLTGNQAELLTQAGFRPNRVFFFDVSEESIRERVTLRRVDPISGERYHLLMKPPANQEILNRLTTHPEDTEESVSQKLEAYLEFAQELEDVYQWGQHVNADQDPLTVLEVVESLLINPLPVPQPSLDH